MVARATGQSVRVVSAESYALTYWTFLQLRECERIDRLLARSDRLDAAFLGAKAFHEPNRLNEDVMQLREEAGLERPATEILDRGRAIMDMIAHARVVDPASEVSDG
jgi:hypothetical protein